MFFSSFYSGFVNCLRLPRAISVFLWARTGKEVRFFIVPKTWENQVNFSFFSLGLCTNMLCYCHYSTPPNYNQSTLYSIDGSVCRWNAIFVNTFSPQTQFQWPSTWFFFARLLAIIFRLAQICASYSVIHFRFEMWFVLLHHHFMHLLAVGYSLVLSLSQPRRRHRHPILIRDDSELIHSFDLCPELSSLTLTFLFSLYTLYLGPL